MGNTRASADNQGTWAQGFFTVPRPRRDNFARNFSANHGRFVYARSAGTINSSSVPDSNSLHTVFTTSVSAAFITHFTVSPPLRITCSPPQLPWRSETNFEFFQFSLRAASTDYLPFDAVAISGFENWESSS